MSVTYVDNKKYTIEVIVPAFKYFAVYCGASNRLREDFKLPNVSTYYECTNNTIFKFSIVGLTGSPKFLC